MRPGRRLARKGELAAAPRAPRPQSSKKRREGPTPPVYTGDIFLRPCSPSRRASRVKRECTMSKSAGGAEMVSRHPLAQRAVAAYCGYFFPEVTTVSSRKGLRPHNGSITLAAR